MYALYNKKNLNLIIFKILWEHTDENHRLQQQDIVHLIDVEYGLTVDRRSVKNNVDALKEMFYNTPFDISTESGYCLLSRGFDDSELRMLIDSVLFSKMISQKQAKDLIEKLKRLSSKHFDSEINHVCNLPNLQHGDNKQLLYNLDIINEAIAKKRKISFVYNSYGTDFKLHPKRDGLYEVNPYQMMLNNGHYYLLGNFDKYDNLAHLRIDKMTDVQLMEEKAKDSEQIPELASGFALSRHLAEHVYMYSGKSTKIILKTQTSMMDELIDWFGKNFTVLSEDNGEITISATCNEQAMFYWALQYGTCTEIIEPSELREKIREAIEKMAEKYGARLK